MRSPGAFRAALLGCFLLLTAVVVTVTWLFVSNAGKHMGADYTAFASNLVRGQYETALLRRSTEAFLDHPNAFHQERILRTLDTIRSREGTTRGNLERRELDQERYEDILAEFDHVNELLPELRQLTEEALADPDRHDELELVAMEVEDTLAFIYSQLHALNHDASGQHLQLTRWLSATVIGLAALVLVVIAGLLWTMDKVVRQRAALERLTVTDTLTNLPNRRALLQRVDDALAHAERAREPVSLALIDIDYFKTINDAHGHPAGDVVLRHFAGQLRDLVRRSDTVARLGGEEFGLLMPDTDERGARELCERIRRRVAETPLPLPGADQALTVSIGLAAVGPGEAASFNTLYVRADQALYEGKHGGRDQVVTRS